VFSMERGRKRFQLSLPVRVRSKNGPFEQTVTENISTTGCYFRSSHPIAIGSEVQMEIAMPIFRSVRRTFKITCRGRVVRVEPVSGAIGIACKFNRYRMCQMPARRAGELNLAFSEKHRFGSSLPFQPAATSGRSAGL
jgi:hypothetical protein